MDKKDVIQVIVLKNGVEQINVTDPKAAVLNIVEDLPAEKKHKSHVVVYGHPKHVFFAQRELDRETQKNVLRGILKGLDIEDEDDDCDDEDAVDRAEAADARCN